MESSKVYVNVMAEFTNDGRLLPRSFIWKDGHVYEIQKVTDVRRAAVSYTHLTLYLYC